MIADQGFHRENGRGCPPYPSNGFASQSVAMRRKEQMLRPSETCTAQELTFEEIRKNRRDVRAITAFMHRPQLAREKGFCARGERIDVRRGNYSYTSGSQ